jgi:hypothetical protein
MRPDLDLDDDGVLAGLFTLGPDPDRARRSRQRCRAFIERRAGTAAANDSRPRPRARSMATRALRKTVVGACCILCVVYVLALVFTTAGLQNLPR